MKIETMEKIVKIVEQSRTGKITVSGVIRNGDVVYIGLGDKSVKEVVFLHRDYFLIRFDNDVNIIFDDITKHTFGDGIGATYHLMFNNKTMATIRAF